jgi:hypothetical protein
VTGASAQIRASQVITTWGPGSLIDLPADAGIVGGLDTAWPPINKLVPVIEPRLARKIAMLTGVTNPGLYAPPVEEGMPWQATVGIDVYRFPEWVLVKEDAKSRTGSERRRRLVHRSALTNGKLDGQPVVPIRFVRACPRGHIEDIDWPHYLKHATETCNRPLWLVERGTGGDLGDLTVECDCGATRGMFDAADAASGALGACRGARPWLGNAKWEGCGLPSRLLVRTASNAHFPQVLSALSLPEQVSDVEQRVQAAWPQLGQVESALELTMAKKLLPPLAAALAGLDDADVLATILKLRDGDQSVEEPPVKLAELAVLLQSPEGYEDDVPPNHDFHARRLPEDVWRRSPVTDLLRSVIQLHRLREVLSMIGFTRFEAAVPDIQGEYDGDVEPAALALEPQWFPAVENRGEGLFLELDPAAVQQWLMRPAVISRLDDLRAGHQRWTASRKSARPFPGGPYVLLHTLSHLLIGAVAMRCGYPASSIRERIYVDPEGGRYALMLYTASPDAEGTLGGLVGQARHIASHLAVALRAGALCSNDPVCAGHEPASGMEGRWLHGASCHGCTLIAETSCEMRNDHLDRALVVPTLAVPGAAFFPALD